MVVAPVVAAPAAPVDDARLRATRDFAVRREPVTAYFRVLAQQTGVPMQASGTVADRKLSLFAKNVPVGEAMSMAADALGANWELVEGTWRLMADPELSRVEGQRRGEREAQRREEVQNAIGEAIGASPRSSPDTLWCC